MKGIKIKEDEPEVKVKDGDYDKAAEQNQYIILI